MPRENTPDISGFFSTTYLSTLVNQKNLAFQASHLPTHWGYVIVGASFAVVFGRPGQAQTIWSFILLCFVLVILSHLGTMVAKAWVNQIRWNLLERKVVQWRLAVPSDRISDDQLVDAVHCYHCKWVSPVSFWKVIAKVFFELGFFPLVVSVILIISYMFVSVADARCETKVLIAGTASLVILIDFALLRYRSAYFREVREVPDIKL